MAKSSRRITTAKRSARRGHPARRAGGVRTVTGGAGSNQSLPGVGGELPADPTPEQLLEMLHAAADPAQLMDQLGEAGLLPSEEETLAVVVGVRRRRPAGCGRARGTAVVRHAGSAQDR